MRRALLLLPMLLSAPALGADSEQRSVQFVDAVAKYCQPFETVNRKKGRLEANGWIEPLDQTDEPPEIRVEELDSFRVFRDAKADLFVLLSSPDADHNYVQDCSVDGLNYDAKQIISLAINRWGKPVQDPERADIWYWSFGEPVAHRIIVSKSRAGFQDHPDSALALTVRFEPLQTP